MRRRHIFASMVSRARQEGVILVITMIVLVAMMLAAIGLIRSVDTTTLIAGNLAFQQSATHSADAGVEAATAWLQSNAVGVALDNDDMTNGYTAAGSAHNPDPGKSWDQFWAAQLAPIAVQVQGAGANGEDSAGNKIYYVIDRLCSKAGSRTQGGSCALSPVLKKATGNSEESNEITLNAPSLVYYRITVRVAGPKNTVSYVQAVVAM